MFESENVETYLADTWPDIDGEQRIQRLRCYVNPLSHDLAQEVDPAIASTLFHKLGTDWAPRSVLNHCRFASNIAPHALRFCRDPEYAEARVFLPSVTISKLEAGKITPESNQWALMFTVTFTIQDKSVLGDLSDLLHEKFFLTFAALQATLPFEEPVMQLACRLCGAESPEWATIDNKFAYCDLHNVNIQEGEHLKRIRNSAMAAAAGAAMQGVEREDEREDPLAATDFNARNRQGRRNKRVAQ